jgi:hypothetical protein
MRASGSETWMLVPLEHAASMVKQSRRIKRFIGANPSFAADEPRILPKG